MSHQASSVPLQPLNFDPARVATPAFVVDLSLLRRNLELLARVQREAGCKVLLALKGFAMFSTFPLVRQYLGGCCASGLHEALLAREEFGKEVHVYSPAFKDEEMRQIIPIADHVSFNSVRQWQKFQPALQAAANAPSPGLRVNPEVSTVEVALYDPCSPGCRLGVRAMELEGADLSGLEGLHFHALCEQGADVLEKVLESVEKNFSPFLDRVKWVNMGGGHHITKPGYDVERLIRIVTAFRERHGVDVYLEPGEAIGLNTGFLVTSVLDIVGGAAALPLARSQKIATLAHETHEPPRTHLIGTRTAADARRAAEALRQRLEETTRGAAGANAAQRIHAEAQCLCEWTEQHGWVIPIDVLAQAADVEDILRTQPPDEMAPSPNAILDTSATCHMPDVLEMPYRPHIVGSGRPGELAHTYRLGGTSCLAGDVIGGYSFAQPLEPGQKLVFTDMAHYTMVKTTTFNGVPHPDIATYDPETDELRVVRRFGYEDFRNKLS